MRPSNLVYSLHDRVPPIIGFLLGLQHVSVIAIAFVFPVMLVREIGGTAEEAAFMVSMSMLAGAVGVAVQAIPKVGSGYLCPQLCGPSFLATSILAAKTGGLPLVFGLTAFAGLVEGVFSRFIHRLKFLFPAEVTGLIVALVGLTVVKVAGRSFLGVDDAGFLNPHCVAVGTLTLCIMVGLNIWTKGKLKLFCVLLGMICGYVVAFAAGELSTADLSSAASRPMFWMPFSLHPGWSFDARMALPVFIAVLCSSLKSVGDITTCQKINDTEWKRPDMLNIRKGILADAIGCFAAGIFGGMGQSTSSSNIGLSIASGATSRVVSFFIAGILAVLAFCPKLGFFFAVMPRPVVGATLVFAVSFMIVAGFQIVMSRMIDGRKTFVIGMSLIFALLADMMPQAFADLPPLMRPVFASSLSVGAISAVLLNLVFRIGISSRASFMLTSGTLASGTLASGTLTSGTLTSGTLTSGELKSGDQAPGPSISEQVFTFFDTHGGEWAARHEVVRRAAAAVTQYLEALDMVESSAAEGDTSGICIEASFDELRLDVTISHPGNALLLPVERPAPDELLECDDAHLRLAGFLVRSYADRTKTREQGGRATVELWFDH